MTKSDPRACGFEQVLVSNRIFSRFEASIKELLNDKR